VHCMVGTYTRKKWKLIEVMTIHPEPSVVAFSANLYKKLGHSLNRDGVRTIKVLIKTIRTRIKMIDSPYFQILDVIRTSYHCLNQCL
jgi:hypothetical protein